MNRMRLKERAMLAWKYADPGVGLKVKASAYVDRQLQIQNLISLYTSSRPPVCNSIPPFKVTKATFSRLERTRRQLHKVPYSTRRKGILSALHGLSGVFRSYVKQYFTRRRAINKALGK